MTMMVGAGEFSAGTPESAAGAGIEESGEGAFSAAGIGAAGAGAEAAGGICVICIAGASMAAGAVGGCIGALTAGS